MVEPLPAATPHDPPLVLLVDENADTRDVFGSFLASCGFAVQEARDGDEALAKLRSAIPDVVVSDVRLPGLDGFSLCREIKQDQRTASIPVIAVTGWGTAATAKEAESAGFDAFILKPCQLDDLLAQIRKTVHAARSACARAKELQATSGRLLRETREVCDQSREVLKRRNADDVSSPRRTR